MNSQGEKGRGGGSREGEQNLRGSFLVGDIPVVRSGG